MTREGAADRFSRQELVAEFGKEGQARLARARVTVVGVGATGGAAALFLARAGVGRLRLIDRDLVEASNLPRQLLFENSDAAARRPKAEAAAAAIRRIDPDLDVEGVIADVTWVNVLELLSGSDLVIDGSDSFHLRYLINDACLELAIPLIIQGVVGAIGQTFTIVGGETACFACYLPMPPPASEVARCDTHGVLGVAVAQVASLAAAAALRLLAGAADSTRGRMTTIDIWDARLAALPLARRADCRACVQRDFRYLRGDAGLETAPLCGRNAVQISAPLVAPDLKEVKRKLETSGMERVEIKAATHLLTLSAPPLVLHLFADGRAIVEGTTDAHAARELYARLVGM